MEIMKEDSSKRMREVLENVDRLRKFNGPPGAFWHRFLACGSDLVEAEFALLLMRDGADTPWKRLCAWPSGGSGMPQGHETIAEIERIAKQASRDGFAGSSVNERNKLWHLHAVRLDIEKDAERSSVAVFMARGSSAPASDEINIRLTLLADLPTLFQTERLLKKAEQDVLQFADALDFMVLLNAETRYMAAAMTFCNEIAARYHCQRVSLGWLKGGYIKLQAISHMEKFEKKMDAVQSVEAAMEEAFDQDEEVVWPKPEESNTIVGNHESFVREQGVGSMISLPLRIDGEPVAVVSCERSSESFDTIDDINGLRVLCDQAVRRLKDLQDNDCWFGVKWLRSCKNGLAAFLGIEHTFVKVLGVLIAVALGVLLFGKWEYRVEAPFILKTDDLIYLPAPFDGYIDKVQVKVGDLVHKNDTLLFLDTKELLLEESSALANRSRYSREAEKARAEHGLADMKIALAMQAQAEAQLEMVRYHLENAQIAAPFDGIVVEGDLKKMLGAPVRKGDILFKVALIKKMYAEIDIDERDVHEVSPGYSGEISFVSRPKLKFPVTVKEIDPIAVAKDKGNIFVSRGAFSEQVFPWWRPGMSGIAKIDIGRRNLLWIFTHRTVDFLRLYLWW